MITETNAERTLEELRAYQAVVATVLRRGESSSVEKELKTTTTAGMEFAMRQAILLCFEDSEATTCIIKSVPW